MTNIPLFGTSASLISPPAGTVTSGYFPLQYLPAEHVNYYFNAATQAVQELVNVIQGAGLTPSSTDTQLRASLAALYGRNPPVGLLLTYVSTTSFSVGAGVAGDTTFTDMMLLASTFTKTSAAWAAGTGNGGKMSAAAFAASTWYYVYLLKNPTTGVVDCGFDVSPTSPTLPTGYTLYRIIGAVKTDGSVHFLQWIMYADGTQEWVSPPTDINDSTLTTTKKSYTLTTVPVIPCRVNFYVLVSGGSAGILVDIYGNTSIADVNPTAGNAIAATQVSSVAIVQLDNIVINAGVLYARSNTASTTLLVGTRDFNVRPFN